MTRRLAAVFAHPDDDAYSVGGSVALAAEDLALTVVLATSGEAGLIAHPDLASPETLGRVREGEARASYAALGASPDLRFLRYADGGLATVDRGELVGRIEPILVGAQPEVVVTFGPEGVTRHDDHVAIHHAATEAFRRARAASAAGFRRLLYASLARSDVERWRELQRRAGEEPPDPNAPFQPRGVPDETIGVRVDCLPVLGRKIEALRAHRTQAAELESIPEEAYPLVFGAETFVIGWPQRSLGGPVLSDIFEGLGDD